MSLLKETIPDTGSLNAQLRIVLESGLPDFLKATQDSREKVKGNIKFVVTAVLFLLAIFIFLFLSGAHFNEGWAGRAITISALAWTTIFLVSGRDLFNNSRLLARQMNMALVSVLSNTLGRMFLYTHNDDHREETKRLLIESELMTIDGVDVQSDDMYTAYGDKEASFRELMITKMAGQTDKTKNQIELFRGVFVTMKLPYFHEAETYISTDGDRSGFAHLNFWSDLLVRNTVQETLFEWNDFEEKLHVASSDATAAREILTPEFMQHLYEWWLEHKLNIRISFKGDMFYMLLPEAKIKIDSTTASADPEAIFKYSWTLLLPIWRSLLLVEDIYR